FLRIKCIKVQSCNKPALLPNCLLCDRSYFSIHSLNNVVWLWLVFTLLLYPFSFIEREFLLYRSIFSIYFFWISSPRFILKKSAGLSCFSIAVKIVSESKCLLPFSSYAKITPSFASKRRTSFVSKK